MTDAIQATSYAKTSRASSLRPAAHEAETGSFLGDVTRMAASGAAGLGLLGYSVATAALSTVVNRSISSVGGTAVDGAGASDPNDFFQKQLEVQREMLSWTFRTNIAKTEHETRMSAVRNMRP